MPNVRAKNKIFFGGFIDRRSKAAIRKAAKKAGMAHNVFGFAIALATSKPTRLHHPSS